MAIKILADSCCDIPEALNKTLSVELVPLTIITASGREIPDDDKLDTDELLTVMKKQKEPIRTACPSVDDYARRMEQYDQCVVITLSAKLSGSYNSARVASEMVLEKHPEKKIFIFDSKSASAGQLRIAIYIKSLCDKNEDFDMVVEKTQKYIDEMHTLFVLEDLSNLVKNGRMSKVKGIVASVLSIYPVLSDNGDGEIKMLHPVRGMKNAMNKLVESVSDLTKEFSDKSTVLTLCHCNCKERANSLKKDILKKCSAICEVIIARTAGLSTAYANDGGIVIAF